MCLLNPIGKWPAATLGALVVLFGQACSVIQVAAAASAGDSDISLTAMAEPPHWPYGFTAPGVPPPKPDKQGIVKAPLLAWVPSNAKHLRALLIIPNNTDSKGIGEHPPVREVAVRREMAIVYLRQGDESHVQSVLDVLAAKTGIREFRHAPWIVLGKSSRGMFPIRMEWNHPKRTIAGISYHAETPTWPVPDSARLDGETILHVNVNGETEWGGTWFVHVRPSLLNYRAQKNWLPHQVVSWGVGHGNYPEETSGRNDPTPRMSIGPIWDYLALFMDKAIELRVPKDAYPTDGPVDLRQVDEQSGFVIDPFAVEDLFGQRQYRLAGSPGGYLVGKDSEPVVTGFSAIPPARDYHVPEGVPVAPLALGRSPSGWLLTEGLNFAMKGDPMTNLFGLEKLRPKPGDKVAIDGHEAGFQPISPGLAGKNGGINVKVIQKSSVLTLLAYTVIEVPEPMTVKLTAPYSVAGRFQIVLNGSPVEHKQVLELQKGLYPLLLVLRLNGVKWNSVEPLFTAATDDDIRLARECSADKERQRLEQEQRRTAGLPESPPSIRKASDLSALERKHRFWVADREQAEAWFKIHAIHGQKFDTP